MNLHSLVQNMGLVILALLAVGALQVLARPASSAEYGVMDSEGYPSLYTARYARRSAPGYGWAPGSPDLGLSYAVPMLEPPAATIMDNYRVLPPVKRLDVRTRSVLCYFHSVSCFFGRQKDT